MPKNTRSKSKSTLVAQPSPEPVDQSIDISGKPAPEPTALTTTESTSVATASPPQAQQIDAAPVYQGAISVAQGLDQDLTSLEEEVAAACVQRVQQSPQRVAAIVNHHLQGAGANPAQFRMDVSPSVESLRADMGLQQA